jgi:hypothetical protein
MTSIDAHCTGLGTEEVKRNGRVSNQDWRGNGPGLEHPRLQVYFQLLTGRCCTHLSSCGANRWNWELISDAHPRSVLIAVRDNGPGIQEGAPEQVFSAGFTTRATAISGCGRLVREVRAALIRREREPNLALRSAVNSIQSDSRATVAGLLLQSQLAIAEPGISPQLSDKLRLVVELAGSLRQRLDLPMQPIDQPHQIRR